MARFTPKATLLVDGPDAKAGVRVLQEAADSSVYCVLAKDGETNAWIRTDIAADGARFANAVISLSDGAATYSFGPDSTNVEVAASGEVSGGIRVSGCAELTYLGAAFDAAGDGETITLLKDADFSGITAAADRFTEGLTIDLDSHVLTSNRFVGTPYLDGIGGDDPFFPSVDSPSGVDTNGAIKVWSGSRLTFMTGTTGSLSLQGAVVVGKNAVLDVSGLALGTGLTFGSGATLAIEAGGTVKVAADTDPKRYPGVFGGTAAGARVHAGDVRYFFDGTTWVVSSGDPVTPGEEVAVPAGRTAESFIGEINGSTVVKAQYLKAPDGVATTDGYLACFDAVHAGADKVKFVLNEEGSNAVAAAEDELKANILESALTATDDNNTTFTIMSPFLGFYYCLSQTQKLTESGTAEEKLAGSWDCENSVEFDLLNWSASGFYWLGISPFPQLEDTVADGPSGVREPPHPVPFLP